MGRPPKEDTPSSEIPKMGRSKEMPKNVLKIVTGTVTAYFRNPIVHRKGSQEAYPVDPRKVGTVQFLHELNYDNVVAISEGVRMVNIQAFDEAAWITEDEAKSLGDKFLEKI